jgi:pyridoxine 4-dehydrogenase
MLLRFRHGPETIRLGDLEVRRLGFGTRRLPEDDPALAHALVRRAVELGVNYLDTAAFHANAHQVIAEALHPYPSDLVIATTVGVRQGDDRRTLPASSPAELRAALDTDLRALRLEALPLVYLQWSEHHDASFGDALEVLIAARRAGKIRELGVAGVTHAQLADALRGASIAAVQHVFGPHVAAAGRVHADTLLATCERLGIAFVPFSPLASGGGMLEGIAQRVRCTPAQLAIAWQLARSPVILPIPGTSKITHLEENLGAVHVAIDAATLAELGTSPAEPGAMAAAP